MRKQPIWHHTVDHRQRFACALVAGDAVVTWLPPSGNSVDVSVRLPAAVRNDPAQLLQIRSPTARARWRCTGAGARGYPRQAPIRRASNAYLQRQVTISANAKGRPPGDVGGDVNK